MSYEGRHHRGYDRAPPQYTRNHRQHYDGRGGVSGVGRPPRGSGGYQTVDPQPNPNPYPPNYPTSPNNVGGNQQFYNGGYNNNYIPPQNYGNNSNYNCHQTPDEPYDYDEDGNPLYDEEEVGGSYFDDEFDYYGDGFNNFGDSFDQQQQQQIMANPQKQQQMNNQQLIEQNQSIIKSLKEPTDVKFSKVEFDMECSFCGRDFLIRHEDPKTKKVSWSIKDMGKLIFKESNGNTTCNFGSKKADFLPGVPIGNHDLIKNVKITAFKSNFPQKMLLSFPTIPTFNNEKARNNSDFFTHLITPAKFDKRGIYSGSVFDREITKGMVEFANTYPGHTPDNMDSKISWIKDPRSGVLTHGLISVAEDSLHPIVFFYNKDHGEKDPLHIRGPSPGLQEINAVLLKKEEIDHYSEMAKTKISQRFSLGNLSNAVTVELSVVMPSGLKNEKNFAGFADARAIFPHIRDVKNEKMADTNMTYLNYFMSQTYHVSFHLEGEYLKLDGNLIDC
jgi:hypothetical protein